MTSRTSPRSASWCASCAPPSSRPSWARPIPLLALALAALTPGAGCKRDRAADAKDRRCQEAIADGRVTEARAWLADPTTRGFEVDKARMSEVAELFYAAGASRVRVAWDELDGTQVSGLFVVEIPAEPAARRRVFAHYAELTGPLELDPETDVGQRCVLVAFE